MTGSDASSLDAPGLDASGAGAASTAAPAGAIRLAVGADYQALVDAAPAGATFAFAPGTHRLSEAIEPKDGQTFLGADGAVLSGARRITQVERADGLFVATGQDQQGLRHATGEAAPGAVRAGFPETFFIDGQPLRPVGSRADVEPGTFFFDYRADRIYFADDPAGRRVEAGVSPAAFDGDAVGVTVRGLVIERFNSPVQHGAVQGGEGWVVENNEVRLNHGVGITVGAGSRIVGNDVHGNGQMGLGGTGAGLLVEGNRIHANGFWSGIDVFWEGGGAKFAVTTGLVVRGNYSHNNHGFGLWTDIDNRNTLYEGNLLVGNDGGGITHEISFDAVIRDNVLIGNGASPQGGWLWGGAIQIQNSSGVEVTGNRIDMGGGLNGIALIQQDRGAGAHGPYLTTGNHVHHNLLVSDGREGASGGAADHDEAGLLDGGNVFDHNRYVMPDGDHWWWGDLPEGWSAYRAGSGQDAGSTLGRGTVDTVRWMTLSPLTAGDDLLNGTTGPDRLGGGGGDDTVRGGGGADRLHGGSGRDAIGGGSGRDRLHGERGGDDLRGGQGDDRLYGGRGGDRLDGGPGRNRLFAGEDGGRDAFAFASAADSRAFARDAAFGFDRGEDVIDLRGIDAVARSAGANDAFSYAGSRAAAHSVWWSRSGGDVVVSADTTGDRVAEFSLRIAGLGSLSPGDILL